MFKFFTGHRSSSDRSPRNPLLGSYQHVQLNHVSSIFGTFDHQSIKSFSLFLVNIILYPNSINSRTRIPVSNAVTAMEVWLLACMLLVFLSLVEYAIILRKIVVHQRNIERRRRQQMRQRNSDAHNGVSQTKTLCL